VDLVTATTVARIHPSAARLTLAGGSEIANRKLLLATGAEPRRIAVPGSDLDGIHYLRTLADCDALRVRLVPGAPGSSRGRRH
jgi:3-phenylpropionate/trans-cinnamate dioxygenase ferredoxin reductase subunit